MSLTNLARKIELLEEQMLNAKVQHLVVDGNSFLVKKTGLQYKPSRTGEQLHNSTAFVRAMMGPVGSGKSTTNCAEIILQAVKMPKCIDGIRRARWAVIRNTYGELETTTLATWLQWFGELGISHVRHKTPIRYTSTFNDGDGNIELEVYFLALDRPEDVKKLESLELTGAFLNEARNIPRIVLERCQERVGRYPQRALCPQEFWSGVILDTNPPDTDSWFYHKFEVLKPEGYFLIKQPPALIKTDEGYQLNPDAENIQFLPKNYYQNAIIGRTEEHINVQILGNYGSFIEGRLVYTAYNDDLHAVDSLEFAPELPVIIGWDFGLTPTAIFAQLTAKGQLQVIAELCSEDMGLENFVENQVKPFISSQLYGFRLESIADPAGNRRGDTDERSCFDVLRKNAFDVAPATTNALMPRIDAVNAFLTRLIDGTPAFKISKKGCPRIRKGFLGGYHLKRVRGTDDKFHDAPEKNEFSHPHDCLQYIALHYRSPKITQETHYTPSPIKGRLV